MSEQSRREFLRSSQAALASLWALQAPALASLSQIACARRDERAAFDVLSPAEARTVEAIAAQIIPTTDTPGATEAGVVYFVDAALAEGLPFHQMLFPIRSGLGDLSKRATELGSTESFADLDDEKQRTLMAEIEPTLLFGLLKTLVVAGFLSDPSYGGNRDKVGWNVIGFDDRHAWQPPFGYYDANLESNEKR